MKKISAVVVLCLIAFCVLFACDKAPEAEVSGTEYKMEINFEQDQLICSQSVAVTNVYKEGLTELVFLLAPNAYSKEAVHKAYTVKLPSYGGINVGEVCVDGVKTEPVFDEDKYYMTVAIPETELNGRRVVDIKYEVTLPECSLRLGKKEDFYNVSNFYPQLAVYSEEGFRKDEFSCVGDPIISDVADFDVTLTVAESMVVACAGNVTESLADGKKVIKATEKNMRDFAFAMNENYTVKTAEKNGVTVKYYSVGDRDYSALASEVVATFSENYVEYPYKNLVLAETAFDAEGMEFSGMCFISDDAEDFENTVIHETIHQWFYNIVGSDNINSPYLDEGLTTFMSEYYYVLKGENEKFEVAMKNIENAYFSYERLQKMRGEKANLAVNKSIYGYSEYSYSMLVYYKTAMMFKHLYETAGKEKFNRAVKQYAHDNYFKRATTDSLVSAFEKGMGCEVKGLIDGWCGEATTTAKFF